MKRLLTTLALIFVASCAPVVSNETEQQGNICEGVRKNHPWSTYHWASDNLSPKVFDKTRNSKWAGEVTPAVQHWAELGTPLQPTMTTNRKAPVSVVEAQSSEWLGLAQIWIQDGHIVQGKVSLNTSALSESRFTHDAAIHVLCQEIGHIWGLGHNRNDLDTCMNDCLSAETYNDWLACINHPEGVDTNAHDVEQLLLTYDHADVVASEPDGGSGGNGPDCTENPNHPRCRNKLDLPTSCENNEGVWITVHTTPIWSEDVHVEHAH